MSDIIEKNVVALTVSGSIVSGKKTNPIDFYAPLTFTEWIVRTNPTETDSAYLMSQYKTYLLQWYKLKKYDNKQADSFVRSSYIALLREIVLNYTTLEERRFISNVDLNNDLELYSVIPFFTKKIKDICQYYSILRQSVTFKKYENSLKGSQSGVVSLLKNEIYKSLQAFLITTDNTNLFNLSAIKNNLKIEIKELFDDSQYFDLNPEYSSTTYNPGFTSTQYTANINSLNTTLFTDFEQSIVDAIKEAPFFLNDFKTSFSVNVQVTANDLQYLRDKDFINQINNNNQDNLNLNLEKQLIENFIGTDYYYVSTNSTVTDYVSGVLFKAQDKASNYLNKRFPSTASVQNENDLKTIREIGGFFLPDKLGVVNFNNTNYKINLDFSNLQPNKIYIFPDPYTLGNISNISLTDFESPIIYEEDVSWMHFDRTAQYLYGNVVSNPLLKNFYGYHSRNQSIGYEPKGMSRDIDSTEFFEGTGKDIWANADVFPVNENKLPIDERQQNLLTINKTLVKYRGDIYGNNYGLYKEIVPTGVGPTGLETGPFISQNELDFFNFTGGRGGLNGTGRKGLNVNQFSEIKQKTIKPCMILDGYVFYDIDQGFNFDFSVPDERKRVSGVFTRTITQSPPGSGYFASYSRLSAYPDPYIYYNIPYPYSAPPSFKPLPLPLLIISYGEGHFIPDNFCNISTVSFCTVLDCQTFLDPASSSWLDYSSDLPGWNTSIPVYYSELLEGSLTTSYLKPNIVDRATFSYTYPASAQVIQNLEGYRFNLAGQTPCAIVAASTQPPPGTFDYSDDTSAFINLPIPDVYKTTVQNLSTTIVKDKTIYKGKYDTTGDLYFKNANTSRVDTISNALSSIFIKYPTAVINDIKNGIVNFDLIYNVIFVETKNYIVIDKLDYNYEENVIEPYNSDKNYLHLANTNKDIEKISNIFFHEKTNSVTFVKTTLLPEFSASNLKIIYPEIYTVDITNPQIKKIYPNFDLNYNSLSAFIHLDLTTNIDRIDTPILTYNEDSNTYLLNYFAKNINSVFCNVVEEFYVSNSNVTFIKNLAYKPEFYIQDYNFTIYNSVTALSGANLTNLPGYYQNTNNFTFWFAASTNPYVIVPEFVPCDYGIVFEEVPVPTPTPSVTPPVTPTNTPTPTPTPTIPPWRTECQTHKVSVSGAGTTAANGIYVLTATNSKVLLDTESTTRFTIFYVLTTDTRFTLFFDFSDRSSTVTAAILSSVTPLDTGTLLYASTASIGSYACVPYGVYDVATTIGADLLAYPTYGVLPKPVVSFYSLT